MASFGTFFDGPLAYQERACLRSFVRHGHRVTLFAYDPVEVPEGVAWADAGGILPRDAFYRIDRGPHRGSASQFSDRFRYAMIRETGLTWIDTDVVCLRPDWPDDEMLIAAQDARTVNGAVLRLPRGPMLDDALAAAERVGALPIWAWTGPYLLTALVQQHGLTGRVRPSQDFYPIGFEQAGLLLRPLPAGEAIPWPRESYCVHLWNEVLRLHGHDRERPPPGSALERLLAAT